MLRRLSRHIIACLAIGIASGSLGCVAEDARIVDRETVAIAVAPGVRFLSLGKSEPASAIFSATVLEVNKLRRQPSDIKVRIDAVNWVADDFSRFRGPVNNDFLVNLGFGNKAPTPAAGVEMYLKRWAVDIGTWDGGKFVMPPIDYFQVGKRYYFAVTATGKGVGMRVVSRPF